MKKWKLFFMAEQVVIGQDSEGADEMGYLIGPNDLQVKPSMVTNIITVGTIHCILYITDDLSIASVVRTWEEFMGFGYTDMIWRIVFGLGPTGGPTIEHIKYITGAHWYLNGEEYFGNIVEWVAAGSPVDVWFGFYKDIMGAGLN